MIPYFESLGEQIERAWLQHSYDESVFPQLVSDVFQHTPPNERTSAQEIIDWVFGPSHGFQQPNSDRLFGQPPVALFLGPRFHIEALFWHSATTAIHQHSFSGVFTVLSGSSLHSRWTFELERVINSRMQRGRLERSTTEILRPGDHREIHSGSRLIHQLFHLEMPSVTIVVRTYEERNHLPQLEYLPPGLAIDRESREGLQTRRLIFLDHMAQGVIGGLRQSFEQLLTTGPVETLYYAFSVLTRQRLDTETLDEFYRLARDRHGEVISLFRRVCEEQQRMRRSILLRPRVTSSRARLLLALLMLMPDREAILETVALEYPDTDPLRSLEDCLDGMGGKDVAGFEPDRANRLIFRALVEGLAEDQILKRLRAEFDDDSIDRNQDRLLDHVRQLAGLELFRPLFSHSPLSRGVSAA